MKIGIISFEEALNSKTLRGVFTTTRYLQKDLQSTGLDVDLLVYGKNKLDYPKGFDIVRHCQSLEDLRELKNTYDFIIYFTPGRSWEKFDENDPDKYIDVIDAVGLPFTTIYHSEEYKTHQPYRMNFISHKDCKFITFITEGFKDIYEDDLKICNDYAVALMLPPLNPLSYILSKEKTDSVIITSAWTNFKRNMDYFELAGDFTGLGIKPYSAGAPSSNFYLNDIMDYLVDRVELSINPMLKADELSLSRYFDYATMMARLKQDVPYSKKEKDSIPYVEGAIIHTKSGHCWYDYGAYYPEQMVSILEDKKFHWNMSCYKVNKAYIPRLEIVTVEALNEGCLPVICRETTPDWITDDSAIRLSKKDYAEHIDILKDMPEDERKSRITKFYELVKSNLYDGVYDAIRDKIMEVVE